MTTLGADERNASASGASKCLTEAQFYEKVMGGATACTLCPRGCRVTPSGTGACLARRNEGGTLYTLNYGEVSSCNLDPIEKKPLRRFYPGSMILSVGSFGCNFFCPFCQNHEISRNVPATRHIPPQELVCMAAAARSNGNIGIAFTYNEPIIWYEYVREAAALAKRQGLKNVLITNGYINSEPLTLLLPLISAMNIDLKGDEAFYEEMCGGGQAAVLGTIKAAHAAGVHVEVTNLLVGGKNDSTRAVAAIAASVAGISDEIPLHLTRYFPRYRMSGAQHTDTASVYEAVAVARRNLKHVYAGNV